MTSLNWQVRRVSSIVNPNLVIKEQQVLPVAVMTDTTNDKLIAIITIYDREKWQEFHANLPEAIVRFSGDELIE